MWLLENGRIGILRMSPPFFPFLSCVFFLHVTLLIFGHFGSRHSFRDHSILSASYPRPVNRCWVDSAISIQPSPLFLARVPDHILSFWNSTPFSFWLYSLSLPTCSINTPTILVFDPLERHCRRFLTSFFLNPQRSSALIPPRGFSNRVAASRAIICPKQTARTRHRPSATSDKTNLTRTQSPWLRRLSSRWL